MTYKDVCDSNPCANGGACSVDTTKTTVINLEFGYICTCRPGWTGDECVEVDECAPNPW